MGYRSKSSYFGKTEETRQKQLANLKSGKGKKRPHKKSPVHFKKDTNHIQFIESEFYVPETRSPIVLLPFQKRILDRLFRKKVKPNLAVIGQPKKSGKSTLSAAIASYYLCCANFRDAEIYLLASDVQQQELTCFNKIVKSIRMNERLRKVVSIKAAKGRIDYEDSFIQILAPNSSLAGVNPSLVIAEELWAWTTTEHKRAWDELTNIPTREENLNLVTSYAGFAEDEDSILYELYKKGLDQQEGRAEKDKQFLFRWFGEDLYEQIPWVTQKYLTQQRNRLRPNTYARLFRNEWASGAENFVSPQILDQCTHNHRKGMSFSGQVCAGVDVGLKHDCSAISIVGKVDDKTLILIDHKVFVPDEKRHYTIDLESTVEKALLQYNKKYNIKKIFYDPYQFQRSAAQLRQSNLKMIEFPQSQANTVEMSETLSDLLHNQRLLLYEDQEIRLHLLNAQAKECQRGWRIVKKRQGKKIDLTIALALACQAATKSFLTSSQRKGRVYIPGQDSDDDDDFSLERFLQERTHAVVGI